MTHRNAPLTPQGRLRLVLRCRHRPIAHIAAEAGVSRQCLGKWVARYREHGEAGLHDRSSAPAQRPTQTPVAVVEQIAVMRKNKWSARRIVRELAAQDIPISVATVTRWLHKLGLARLDHLDVDGEPLRRPGTIKAWWPGHMIHIDVKKVGRIPDGGGWRIHGINSDQARAAARATAKAKASGTRPGYVYLHSAVDGFSRLAYTEALEDETAKTAIGFLFRARVWFAAHGVTPLHPDRDRQRLLLSRQGLHPRGVLLRRAPSADQALHAPPQRQGGAIPADPGQRTALRPPLAQRRPPPRRDRDLEPALQLPSTPQRRRRPAPGLTLADRRHQRHEQLQLVHIHVVSLRHSRDAYRA